MINPAHLAVTVEKGAVTRRGGVDTCAEKWAVKDATRRVGGVRTVAQQFTVENQAAHVHDDSEVAAHVQEALDWNVVVPGPGMRTPRAADRGMSKHADLLVALVFSSLAAGALAQGGPGPRADRPGFGARYTQFFDAKAVATFDGEVVEMTKVPGMGIMGFMGVHATLKTAQGVLDIHLGPEWFIENQELKVAAKDKISVTGSRVTMQGKPTVMAIEIRRGDESLRLRDPDGLPVWVAARRRL
jgi:hypothetical protein